MDNKKAIDMNIKRTCISNAQLQVEEKVKADKEILSAAKERAQKLIQNYIDELEKITNVEYEIEWRDK